MCVREGAWGGGRRGGWGWRERDQEFEARLLKSGTAGIERTAHGIASVRGIEWAARAIDYY